MHQRLRNVTNDCIWRHGRTATPTIAAIRARPAISRHREQPFAVPRDDRFSRYESLRAALDLIDQGFTLIDSNLRFVAWNKTFLRLLDFPPEMGYVGAPFESFIRFNAERGEYGPGNVQGSIDERLVAARAFAPHEIERTRPDGTVLLVRGVPVPGHGFVTLYSDITARKHAEAQIREHNAMLETRVAERTAELRRSEARMRLITDSIPALIAYFDRDGVYRYLNRGYHDWFGLDTSNPGGMSAKQYLGAASDAGIRPNVARALAGEAVTFEYETSLVGGRRVIARTTLIPEIDAEGTVAGCFELTFDITEQKHAQEMLVQAQKMEGLGQLSGGLGARLQQHPDRHHRKPGRALGCSWRRPDGGRVHRTGRRGGPTRRRTDQGAALASRASSRSMPRPPTWRRSSPRSAAWCGARCPRACNSRSMPATCRCGPGSTRTSSRTRCSTWS